MKLALFSDVHGRLRIVLHLIRNWQMEHKTHLDGALIAGDLGCFPDIAKLDKSTRRWMESDPEEAGFSRFFTQPVDTVATLFKAEFGAHSDVSCPIFFVPGNHEDYAFLEAEQRASDQATFTVDCYRRFHCIRDGAVINLPGHDGNRLRVAGIWGIEKTLPQAPYQLKPDIVRKLVSRGEGNFDFLLTHDAPAVAYPTGGSEAVTRVIRACKPSIHLFGHVHPVDGRHQYNVPNIRTRSFLLRDISFGKKGDENLSGTMAILDWDGTDTQFELVQDNWIKRMRRGNWEQTWPECVIDVVPM
jgi:Icc-related predicted phosphoesterase